MAWAAALTAATVNPNSLTNGCPTAQTLLSPMFEFTIDEAVTIP